jgi:hypothetical protein
VRIADNCRDQCDWQREYEQLGPPDEQRIVIRTGPGETHGREQSARNGEHERLGSAVVDRCDPEQVAENGADAE